MCLGICECDMKLYFKLLCMNVTGFTTMPTSVTIMELTGRLSFIFADVLKLPPL